VETIYLNVKSSEKMKAEPSRLIPRKLAQNLEQVAMKLMPFTAGFGAWRRILAEYVSRW